MATSIWTAPRLEHRRHLHARIDLIAAADPTAAARLRLALYTATHEADTGAFDEELLDLALEELDAELGSAVAAITAAAAAGAAAAGAATPAEEVSRASGSARAA